MNATVRYGTEGSFTLDVAPEALVAECGRPGAQALDDPAAAMAAALVDPIDFPPLNDVVVSGDLVTIALDEGVPKVAELIAGLVQSLCEAGVEAENITILRTEDEVAADRGDPREGLRQEIADRVQLSTHDSSDRDELGYLAAAEDGKPIYLNRKLLDADVVLPISCLRVESSSGYYGAMGGLFPLYSDDTTRARFRSPRSEDSKDQRRRRRTEAEEAGSWLGAALSIQVVPGAAGSVLHILAGSVSSVTERGRELCRSAWNYPVPHRASLVIAAIEGDASCQTWDNVARAVTAAMGVVAEGGAIAVCTELEVPPSATIRQLGQADDFVGVLRSLRMDKSPDAVPATQLLRAVDGHRVYLVSQLDPEVVEPLGIAAVSDIADIVRLTQRHESCIVLANAQYTVPTAIDDSTAA